MENIRYGRQNATDEEVIKYEINMNITKIHNLHNLINLGH